MRARGCVHMLVLISPSSPLSLCPHIQMSQHLSCKCLPARMIRRRTCLWPRFPFAFLCLCVCVCAHSCMCCIQSSKLCVCVYDQITMEASLTELSAVPETALRGPALSLGVDKRTIFKGRRGKTARPCQGRRNSPLTP